MTLSLLCGVWLGVTVVVLVLSFAQRRARARYERPRIHTEGLTWTVRHASVGDVWNRPTFLVAITAFLLVPAVAIRWYAAVSVFVSMLACAALWLLRGQLWSGGQLRASADGLAWKRAWPHGERQWAWRELRRVRAEPGALCLETVAGDGVRIPLPEAELADLRAVGEALEGTRAKPPPERLALPEVPAALRGLQRSAGP